MKMKRYILVLGSVAMMAATSHALEITLTPGSLRSELPALVNTQDRSLVLKGRADVTDLALLKNMSRAVTTLDMSGLRIAAYTYTDGDYLGSVSFSDDEIPPRGICGDDGQVSGFGVGYRRVGVCR